MAAQGQVPDPHAAGQQPVPSGTPIPSQGFHGVCTVRAAGPGLLPQLWFSLCKEAVAPQGRCVVLLCAEQADTCVHLSTHRP